MNKKHHRNRESRLSAAEWLQLIFSDQDDEYIIDYHFPDDRIKDEYLSTIDARSDKEVIELMKKFLIQTSSLGCDERHLKWLEWNQKNDPDTFNQLLKFQ